MSSEITLPMRSPIDAKVLLAEVIAVLKNDILPTVVPEQKFPLLMCLNALQISLRSLSETVDAEAVVSLEELDGLTQAIKQGQYDVADAAGQAAFAELLEKLTVANKQDLLVSNPKRV